MSVLLQILALLQQIAGSPLVAKVTVCLITQSGWPAILSCIMSAQATTPQETAVKDGVVAAIKGHMALNP